MAKIKPSINKPLNDAFGGEAGAPKLTTNALAGASVTTLKMATNERMSTANVLGQTAGLSAGAVGSYAFLYNPLSFNQSNNTNGTRAGSQLRYSSTSTSGEGANPPGTWRCVGFANQTSTSTRTTRTVWVRIS